MDTFVTFVNEKFDYVMCKLNNLRKGKERLIFFLMNIH